VSFGESSSCASVSQRTKNREDKCAVGVEKSYVSNLECAPGEQNTRESNKKITTIQQRFEVGSATVRRRYQKVQAKKRKIKLNQSRLRKPFSDLAAAHKIGTFFQNRYFQECDLSRCYLWFVEGGVGFDLPLVLAVVRLQDLLGRLRGLAAAAAAAAEARAARQASLAAAQKERQRNEHAEQNQREERQTKDQPRNTDGACIKKEYKLRPGSQRRKQEWIPKKAKTKDLNTKKKQRGR
jgi:hypothetical protein